MNGLGLTHLRVGQTLIRGLPRDSETHRAYVQASRGFAPCVGAMRDMWMACAWCAIIPCMKRTSASVYIAPAGIVTGAGAAACSWVIPPAAGVAALAGDVGAGDVGAGASDGGRVVWWQAPSSRDAPQAAVRRRRRRSVVTP